MFTTRSTWIIDLAYCVTLSAPVITLLAVRLAKAGKLEAHRRMQIIMAVIAVAAVLLLEVQIRLSGGSGSLLNNSPYAGTPLLRWVAVSHISGAILTYILWIWLLIASSRRWRMDLPGRFSITHRRAGWLVFLGLVFTAVSATAVYFMGFVL